ncbi:hypothetical protein N7467_005299 [Penicillium canescens]|nr:hypothetical protein N7467_005299 [Penicillium canescens]
MVSLETSQSLQDRNITRLNVEFSWKKWNTVITDDCNLNFNPIYTVSFQKSNKPPHFFFKSAPDYGTIGTGTLHIFSINAEYKLHGQKDTLVAQKRYILSFLGAILAYPSEQTDTPSDALPTRRN